jgi:hypothetical protein
MNIGDKVIVDSDCDCMICEMLENEIGEIIDMSDHYATVSFEGMTEEYRLNRLKLAEQNKFKSKINQLTI